MRYPAAVILGALLLPGCGVPTEPAKQAEDLESIAAEGALLAHDAAEGETTTAFAQTHSQALAKQLDPLRKAIQDQRLARVADEVARLLDALHDDPTDRDEAARIERRLARDAEAASRIGGSG